MTERVMRQEDKYFQAFSLSLLLHIGLFGFYNYFLPAVSQWETSTVPVEIVFEEKTPKKGGKDNPQIVADPEISDKILEKVKKQAQFLSLLNRRVKEQMVSRNKGDQNINNPNINHRPSDMTALKLKGKPLALTPDGSVSVFSPPREERLGKSLVLGQSMTRDHIPNVKQGGFTALNTDQFTFYTFFSRINEQIYPRWVRNLRQVAHQTPVHYIRQAQKSEWVTELVLVFDREGHFVNYEITRSSGLDRLDLAAVEAFRDAAPFLNPPEDMIERDGKFRLVYSFYLILQPSLLASP